MLKQLQLDTDGWFLNLDKIMTETFQRTTSSIAPKRFCNNCYIKISKIVCQCLSIPILTTRVIPKWSFSFLTFVVVCCCCCHCHCCCCVLCFILQSQPATVNGMLGGFESVSLTDLQGSNRILEPFLKVRDARLWLYHGTSPMTPMLQCIQKFFSQTLILKNRFLVRLSSNFQERLFMPSSSPEFLLWWGYF